eukprot:s822_g6.t1
MESGLSDGRIVSGQLFTAFDEETKGTRIPAHFRQQSGSGSGGSEHKLVVNIACSEVPALPGPSERYYGILTSKGEIKSEFSCVSNATEPSQAWLEELYPDCESRLEENRGRDPLSSIVSLVKYVV